MHRFDPDNDRRFMIATLAFFLLQRDDKQCNTRSAVLKVKRTSSRHVSDVGSHPIKEQRVEAIHRHGIILAAISSVCSGKAIEHSFHRLHVQVTSYPDSRIDQTYERQTTTLVRINLPERMVFTKTFPHRTTSSVLFTMPALQ